MSPLDLDDTTPIGFNQYEGMTRRQIYIERLRRQILYRAEDYNIGPWDVDELRVLDPPPWLINERLRQGADTLMYGPPGVAKSWVALDLAIAVATGRPWLGRPVTVGPVLLLDAENREWVMGERLRHLCGDATLTNLRIFSWPFEFPLNERVGGDMLESLILDYEPKVVILDTMTTLFRIDENDPAEVTAAFKRIGRLRDVVEYSTVALHHTRKGPVRAGPNAGADALRGSIAFQAVADHLWQIVPGRAAAEGHISVELHERKNRTAAKASAEQLDLDLTAASSGFTAKGCESEPGSVGRVLGTIETLLSAGEMPRAEILERLRGREAPRTIALALAAGLKEGRLLRPRRGVYSLAT